MLAQQLINALSLGSVYALFALGFTLIFGVLHVINLSHGAVFMVGAYAALQAAVLADLPIGVALVVAFVISGIVGLAIDMLVLAPLRKRDAPHLIPMIATIGVAIMLNSAVQGLFGADNLRFPQGFVPDGSIEAAGVHMTVVEIGIIVVTLIITVAMLVALQRTSAGKALRAVAESPKAAALLGINVEGLLRKTSFLAAGIGGVSGVLISLYSNAVFPLMGQPMLHKGIAVIILGGMGDIRGALIGGLFLGFAEVFAVAYIGSTMRDAVAFGLLFLILLVRPTGLFGKASERKA